jgi:hypothetical protein
LFAHLKRILRLNRLRLSRPIGCEGRFCAIAVRSRRLAEIWRVLKPGGLYQGTMLSKRDGQFGRGRPVAPDTFIRGSGPKAHPHYYCDLAGLAALFAGFELLSLTQEEQRRPGSWHWHILAERR